MTRPRRIARVTSLLDDPTRPPPPLLQPQADGSVGIIYREGGQVTVPRGESVSRKVLFLWSVFGSMVLDGQPLRCSGFAPGVSLRAQVTLFPQSLKMAPDVLIDSTWRYVEPYLERWLADVDNAHRFELRGAVHVVVARDALTALRPGVMQIDVVDLAGRA